MTTRSRKPRAPKILVQPSPLHGRGLFADARIPKDQLIGVYEGKRTRRDGPYVLWLDDREGIDGRNELRFVNHSRKPNAVFMGEELWSLKTIEPGEEITHHYGDDWEPPRRRHRAPKRG